MSIDSLHLDGLAFAFAAALCGLVAIAAGVVPALRITATGLHAPGSRTATASRSHRRAPISLVAVEVALALILVSGCGLLLRSFVNLLRVDTGFQQQGVVALQVFRVGSASGPGLAPHLFRARDRPTCPRPRDEIGGGGDGDAVHRSTSTSRASIRILGQPPPATGEEPRTSFNVATPGYLRRCGFRWSRPPSRPARRPRRAARGRHHRRARCQVPGRERSGGRPPGLALQRPAHGSGGGRCRGRDAARGPRPTPSDGGVPSGPAGALGSMTLVARTRLEPRMLISRPRQPCGKSTRSRRSIGPPTLDELVGRRWRPTFALMVLTGFSCSRCCWRRRVVRRPQQHRLAVPP